MNRNNVVPDLGAPTMTGMGRAAEWPFPNNRPRIFITDPALVSSPHSVWSKPSG